MLMRYHVRQIPNLRPADIPKSQDNRNMDAMKAIRQQLNVVLADSRRMESKVSKPKYHNIKPSDSQQPSGLVD
jgi:hypothetical protein